MKPRQIATFGLEHQFVIYLVSPCNVDGDIINMRASLIDHIGQKNSLFLNLAQRSVFIFLPSLFVLHRARASDE